jgi:hypothetical protein
MLHPGRQGGPALPRQPSQGEPGPAAELQAGQHRSAGRQSVKQQGSSSGVLELAIQDEASAEAQLGRKWSNDTW